MKEIIYNYTYAAGCGGGMIKTNVKIPIGGTFFYNGDTYLVTEEAYDTGVDFFAKRL